MTSPTVLVADADKMARDAWAGEFARYGWTVCSCGSLASAREAVLTACPACAIVDVRLEDADGVEAAKELRGLSHTLPIIVTASENSRDLEARVRRLGVTYYHVKGFDRAELIEAVREALKEPRRPPMTKRILVIDDDADYQAAVRTILESGGYTVVSAYSRAEGQAKIEQEPPDLILLDIMMEHATDGFHFLYDLKSGPRPRSIPVIAVTAVSERTGFDFAPKKDGDYFPADDYMAKPVKAEDLLGRVRALLEKGK